LHEPRQQQSTPDAASTDSITRISSGERETALLVGVARPGLTSYDMQEALGELEHLAVTAGARVIGRLTQSLSEIDPATFIGEGKVQELAGMAKAKEADIVIFDGELTPGQVQNIEKEVGCKLLDRTGLILDIFASRAQTAAAKTQVELAQLDYIRSRLTRRWTHLSRQEGGIGTKGPGETQIETDRRLIDTRMAKLRRELDEIDQQRQTQRKGRTGTTRVSVVGYTNAGKSTLMNALAGADVLAEDRLFATLDATTRQVQLDTNKDVLLSDTVGFIRKLPHALVESFKSTLDETRESDALLHVVDVTHRSFEDHMRVVRKTLGEMGAKDKPTLVAFNKIDALKDQGLIGALKKRYPNAVFVSALRGIGLSRLEERLLEVVEQHFVERRVCVPVTAQPVISFIHDVADVREEDYLYAQNGRADAEPQAAARMRFRLAPRHDARLQSQLEELPDLRPLPDQPPAVKSVVEGAVEDASGTEAAPFEEFSTPA
jgi:GTP-binding protein HflX